MQEEINASLDSGDVTITLSQAADFFQYNDGWGYGYHDGEKFPGQTGFGGNTFLAIDYWALRTKSSEVFERNLYARGIIRRLVTNIVVTGLALESTPSEGILGMSEGSLDDWTDMTEEQFELWANDPKLCDFEGKRTFAHLQEEAKREALVTGDILVVQRMSKRYRVPQIQLIDGRDVQTPANPPRDARIYYGVEVDKDDRPIAYWVTQEDGSSVRMPANGSRSGRRLAWLYFGSDKRMSQVRGQPILAQILQSLKEIDRFRDSTQRKAVINSMLALFVKKEGDGVGTRMVANSAVRKSAKATPGEGAQGPIQLNAASMTPGVTVDRLAPGEEPVAHKGHGADQSYSDFEAGIVRGLAWALEIPPEILQLSFNANYSASAAAINEFGMFLTVQRQRLGDTFCKPFYNEWLLGEVMARRIEAPGLVDAWRENSGNSRYIFAAWIKSEWNGQVKPSTDMFKMMKGVDLATDSGFLSFDRASRLVSGTKWRNNVRKQRRERQLAAEAGIPLSAGSVLASQADDPGGDENENENENEGQTNEVAD